NLHPEYRQVIDTYIRNAGIVEVTLGIDPVKGTVSSDSLAEIDADVGAVIVQSPNFFGAIEDLEAIAGAAHRAGALMVVVVAEAMSLGLLRAPGEYGADIVCGEAQSFGIPLSFGGSYCGFFATKEKYQRQLPGRLVGKARDGQGRDGYVLTLATREQHIRREKATSNICTNQGLYALMTTIYLSLMGPKGLRETAEQNLQKSHYLARQIDSLPGFRLKYRAPFFNEFVVSCPRPANEVLDRLLSRRIIG